jgi:DtxR family Mn-dependent transcriptional regulator
MTEANHEDFLEALLTVRDGEWALTSRVADHLGIRIHSAFVSAKKLSDIGLLLTRNEASELALTPKGEELAKNINRKHALIRRFLMDFLCVPADVAEEDAHNMEHVISDESLEKITGFFEFIEKDPEAFINWFSTYKAFVCPIK